MKKVYIGNGMVDIRHPDKDVEVTISKDEGDGHTMWINVDGVCRLRISRVDPGIIKLDDRR